MLIIKTKKVTTKISTSILRLSGAAGLPLSGETPRK
jgi:hypothetical protein